MGALIVRVWMENEDPTFLRARIVHTTETTAGEWHIGSAATPEEACEAVAEWLETFIREAPESSD